MPPDLNTKLHLSIDDDDARDINAAIAVYQRRSHQAFGEVIVPEGASCQAGAILAEICRAWMETHH